MTPAGFSRLIDLYVADLTAVRYTLDGALQTNTSFTTQKLSDNNLEITVSLPDTQNGVFANFEVIATGDIISTTRQNTFTKTGETILFKIPFVFVNG